MRMPRAAVPLLTLSLVLAACSASTTGGTPQASAQAPTPAASAAASPSAAAGGITVNLADSTLGKVLADGTGKTLYVFTPDAAAAGKSVCNGDCATNWPPLLSDAAPTPGTGLDAEDFTTIARDDGTKQVAFYGHPLYFFAGDKAAGDTTGQGVGGKWYAVGADGNMIGAEAASPSAAASGGVSVALADNALGKILVGENGMTLYIFTADSGGKSVCNGDCAGQLAAAPLRRGADARRRARRRGLRDHQARRRQEPGHLLRPTRLLLRGRQGRGRHRRPGAQQQVVRGRRRREADQVANPPLPAAGLGSLPIRRRRSGPAASLARLGRCASHTSVNDTPPQAPHGDSRRRSIPGARGGSISRSPAAARSRPTRTSRTMRCSTASP